MARAKLPRWGPWLALASAGVFAGLAWVVHPRVQTWRATSRAREELSALASCLLGSADPRQADDIELRRRAISSSITGEDWPARCASSAAGAEVALSAAQREPACRGDARCEALARTRGLLAEVRTALATGRFEHGSVAALFEHASALGMHAETHARPLPPPVEPVAAAPPLFVGGAAERHLDPAFGNELRVLFHEPPRRARLCALRGKRARCWSPPPALPLRARLVLPSTGAGAPPLVLAHDTGELHDLARGTAVRIEGADAQAHVEDGALVTLVRQDGAWWWRGGNERKRLEGEALLTGKAAHWLDGHELVRLANGEVQAIGTIDLREPLMQSCATPSTSVLLLSAAHGNETPVVLAFASRLVRATVPARGFGFTCHHDHADLTWIETLREERTSLGNVRGSYRVLRMRCRAAGCRREQAELTVERHHRASRYFAASLGDALAFLWRSPLGDVRLRSAPPRALATAKDRSLFDDRQGLAFDDGHTELFVRGDTGYLLIEREQRDGKRAVHAFAIDAHGGATGLGHRQ